MIVPLDSGKLRLPKTFGDIRLGVSQRTEGSVECIAVDRQQGYALADHIVNRCRLTKLLAFRVNDCYRRTGIAEFRDAARCFKAPLRAELRWDRGHPRWSEFVRTFKDKFGHEPESFAAHAFDGANILIAAIRRAGLNRARIRDVLYESERYAMIESAIVYGPMRVPRSAGSECQSSSSWH